jgi:2-iminobutanoate/2-iminopropanoate deaminase
MTTRHAITTGAAPAPRGWYSPAVVAGGVVYTAGLGPLDPEHRTVVGTDAGEQTRQVLRNLAAILQAAGSDLEHVVKLTAHLADVDRDWDAFDAACREFLPGPPPARTTVGSVLGDILVEIDVIAIVP